MNTNKVSPCYGSYNADNTYADNTYPIHHLSSMRPCVRERDAIRWDLLVPPTSVCPNWSMVNLLRDSLDALPQIHNVSHISFKICQPVRRLRLVGPPGTTRALDVAGGTGSCLGWMQPVRTIYISTLYSDLRNWDYYLLHRIQGAIRIRSRKDRQCSSFFGNK
jgi:hypothetical protein